MLGHKKAREVQKNIYFCFIDYAKAFVCITKSCGKFLKRWEYQIIWSASWEICMQVKKQQLELDMEEQTGSNLGKEYVKAVYCHSAYITYMQGTSCEMPGWMKHKLESRLPGKISITSDFGWMASQTPWTWVWVGSRSWWWLGKPVMLESMGQQWVWHDWMTELNWWQRYS